MEIVIKFTTTSARRTEYYLQKRYKSKARLPKLAKLAILTEAANEAEKEAYDVLHNKTQAQ